MQASDILFDDHLEMNIVIKPLGRDVRLCLSDDLFAADEVLTEQYRNKIAHFINQQTDWYDIAVKAVLQRASDIYRVTAKADALQLMTIFILFEQNDPPVFGLGFNTDFDREHGCGLQMDGESYAILTLGTADVAFC